LYKEIEIEGLPPADLVTSDVIVNADTEEIPLVVAGSQVEVQ
jgi:hypothetical protein